MFWLLEHGLYFPMFLLCCGVVLWHIISNSNDIRPGPPNARTGE